MKTSRNVSTYSIVAIDKAAGEMGVAVQSHWFSVGSVVPWAEAGVGVVATQAFVDLRYGPRGLALMRKGQSPRQALDSLLHRDSNQDRRQVAMLDAKGKVATHTGSLCLPEAGHVLGPGYSAQANLMSSDRVWPEMAAAFRRKTGPLSSRLMAALEAAEAAGGDLRGRQSAAMVVVKTESPGAAWLGRIVDVRVDDNRRPLSELRRLLDLNEAFNHANAGDDLVTEGKMVQALSEYAEASRLAPHLEELKFWQAVALADYGRVKESMPIFSEVFRKRSSWRKLLAVLPRYGLLSVKADVLRKLVNI